MNTFSTCLPSSFVFRRGNKAWPGHMGSSSSYFLPPWQGYPYYFLSPRSQELGDWELWKAPPESRHPLSWNCDITTSPVWYPPAIFPQPVWGIQILKKSRFWGLTLLLVWSSDPSPDVTVPLFQCHLMKTWNSMNNKWCKWLNLWEQRCPVQSNSV